MTGTMTTTSSALQSGMTSVGFITPTQLQQMMHDKLCSVQIVDSRSFLNYNTERITGSVNIYCPPLVKRRFQTCLPLNTMLSRETRAMLCRPSVDTVVIHDQFTDETLFRMGQSDLQLILMSLVKFLGQRQYLILSGGYFRFRQEWPSMCSSHTSLSGQLCHLTRHVSSPNHIICPKSPSTIQALHLNTTKNHSMFSLTPVELLPYLFIGDADHSSRMDLLRKFRITAILNVSTSCENHFPDDFRYKVIPVEDSNNANLLEWFQSAILFIEREKECGGTVLVHCYGGISRSATVCLAYLMYTRHLILDEAFEYVKSRRHIISPNANFMMQLSQFEKELRNLGFIRSAASLQKPLSPRRLSSVVSCPDMSQFMSADQEMSEEDEVNIDNNDDDDDDNKRGIHDESDSNMLRTDSVCDTDNNNSDKSNDVTIGSDSGMVYGVKNDNNISVDFHNGNRIDEADGSSSPNSSNRDSPYSTLKHNQTYLSQTLTSSS